MTRSTLGAAVRAVGLICALVALWAGASDNRYWQDGTFSGFVLLLGIPALLALAAGISLRQPWLERVAVALGSLLFGMYLFTPVGTAALGQGQLGSSMWLGLCSALVPLSLLVDGHRLGAGTNRALFPLGSRVAAVGLGLVVVSIWTRDLEYVNGRIHFSYWSWPTTGHGLGICLLALVAAAALLLLASIALRALALVAIAFGAAAGGFALFSPVAFAFDFQHLAIGGWIGGVGGVVFLLGALLLVVSPGLRRAAVVVREPVPDAEHPSS